MIDEEITAIRDRIGDAAFATGRWDETRLTFTETALADEYVESLTLPAYARMP